MTEILSLHIGLIAEAEPAPAPDRFQVRLRWQTPASEAEFEIVRSHLDGSGEETLPVPWREGVPGFGPGEGRDQTYVDSEVLPVTGYRYTVRAEQQTEPESAVVEVPGNELEIRGRRTLSELDLERPPVHRLLLREGAELVTEGRDLALRLIEIFAENALIVTFPEGSVAAPGQPGRPGGSISIHAHRGFGLLTILGRGEQGGQGTKGERGAPGKEGDPGRPSKLTRIGRTSEGDFNCTSAGDGKPGKPGGVGKQGGQGFPGGDSARVEILIDQPSELKLDIRLISGEGGAGGEGGEGGPGGPGGDRGSNRACGPRAHRGSQGPPGPAGPPGERGKPGQLQTCCAKINGKALEGYGDCDD